MLLKIVTDAVVISTIAVWTVQVMGIYDPHFIEGLFYNDTMVMVRQGYGLA